MSEEFPNTNGGLLKMLFLLFHQLVGSRLGMKPQCRRDGWRGLSRNVERSGVITIMMMRVMKTLFALHQPWECEIWPGYDPFLAQCLSKFDVAVEPTRPRLAPPVSPDHLRGGGRPGTPGGHIWTSIRVRARPPGPQGPGGCWTNLVMVVTPPGVTSPVTL